MKSYEKLTQPSFKIKSLSIFLLTKLCMQKPLLKALERSGSSISMSTTQTELLQILNSSAKSQNCEPSGTALQSCTKYQELEICQRLVEKAQFILPCYLRFCFESDTAIRLYIICPVCTYAMQHHHWGCAAGISLGWLVRQLIRHFAASPVIAFLRS